MNWTLFLVISLVDMSVGFWLFVFVAIITGVILYNVHLSEQTVFSFVAVGGILSFIVSK
jgi:hypothetical protein